MENIFSISNQFNFCLKQEKEEDSNVKREVNHMKCLSGTTAIL